MKPEDYEALVTDAEGGRFTISQEVPGHGLMGGPTFESFDDTVAAIKLAFAAYRSGRWCMQQDFRNLLDIRKT